MRHLFSIPGRAEQRSGLAWLLSACMSLAACAADEPASLPERSVQGPDPQVAAQAVPANLSATVKNVTYSGSGCPSKSVAAGKHETGVELQLSTFELELDEKSATRTLSRECTLDVELEVPSGYQLVKPLVEVHRQAMLTQESPGAAPTIDASITYSFGSGGETLKVPVPTLRGPGTAELLSQVRHNPSATSPTCSNRTAHLTITAKATVTVPPGSTSAAYFNLSNITLHTARDLSAVWRACGSSTDARPPEAAPGAACGGAARTACSGGATCQPGAWDTYFGIPLPSGRCPSSNPSATRAGHTELCGGSQNIQCGSGLTCSYPTANLANGRYMGTCAYTVGQANSICGSYSKLKCGPDLMCQMRSPDHGACVGTQGGPGHACGQPGTAACQSGLACTEVRVDSLRPGGAVGAPLWTKLCR